MPLEYKDVSDAVTATDCTDVDLKRKVKTHIKKEILCKWHSFVEVTRGMGREQIQG